MRVYGIDFTCAPSRKKPVTCAVCRIRDNGLVCDEVLEWPSKKFTEFENLLASNGPWIMGVDTPFGVAKKKSLKKMAGPKDGQTILKLLAQ